MRAVQLRGAADHPTTRGRLCPKVNRYLDRVYHPDRLLTPLRRVGPKGSAGFAAITWDDALDDLARRMATLRAAGRPEAVLQVSFAGTQGVLQMGVVADAFFDAYGARDIRRHLCGVTATLGAADVLGTPYGMDPADLRHSRTILLWGTDTLLTNRHLWPEIETAREAGAIVVVIDPIRTATAERADVHLQLRPGTDVALVLGVVHVLDRDNLLDAEWLAGHTDGWESLRHSASELTPDAAARATGLPAERIEWLAHTYATRRPAAIRTLIGAEHRRHGRDILRAVSMLPAVTGAMRERGGGLARSTGLYADTALTLPPRAPDRLRFNMSRLGEVLTGGDVDLLVVHNCNPAVTFPDQNRVIAGLERDDLFTVVVEQRMTDTARYADLVLPATTQVEQLDLMTAWGHLYLALNAPAIPPRGQCLPNTEIFRRLAARLGLDTDPRFGPWLRGSDEELLRRVLDSDHPWLDGITLDRLQRDGWARLAVPEGFSAPGPYTLGAVEFHPPTGATPRFPLLLQTRKQHIAFLNSHYAGDAAHRPHHGELRVSLHPDDAADRAITAGATVVVHNDRGRLTCRAELDPTLLTGVVTMPFGWWNDATPERRGVNALTDPGLGARDAPDDAGSAAFHDTWVEVSTGLSTGRPSVDPGRTGRS